MADTAAQNYGSHRRYHPIWHFVGFPIVMINVFVEARELFRMPSKEAGWDFVFALGLLVAVFAARVQTLTVQNRVIRLEMRQRFREVLATDLAARAQGLSVSHLVGLRFAGDAELPALVERCLKGELANGEAVKKEIKNWQADWLRA
jgi:hypothetical protein